MEINPTTTSTSAAAAAPKTETQESANTMAGDFQTFLTLLTTQMRNQDPLKPMESTEFVAQLASFSGVEQQIRANDRLESILGVLSGGSADGLAAWIGREVRVPGKADFSGEALEIGVAPVEGADRTILVVQNDFGQDVARRTVTPQDGVITWDGTDGLGTTLANGRYGFKVESYTGETLSDTQTGQVFAKVSEVRIEGAGPVLLTEGGGRVALDEVTAVR
jgi:flagellar basal-body rod modification protein FlgD